MEEMTMATDERIQRLIQAFATDGYDVDPNAGVRVYEGNVGIAAPHRTATIGKTGRHKKAFYIEGPPYTMGYLMALLAEPDISRMCEDFNEKVIFDFIGVDLPDDLERILGELLKDIVALMSLSIKQDLPLGVKGELRGLLDGSRAVNPKTRVSEEGLEVLNYGIDGLLAFLYTGLHPTGKPLPPLLKPKHLRIPLMCNGFSIAGQAVEGGGHFMGRDFMFPTADVFQDTASYIIHRPSEGLPTVSVAAPGMVGSITALNSNGVGAGVDIEPSGACNPSRPGLNSLLLVRHSVEHGATCEDAVTVMEGVHRGVSWAYILADGSSGRACVVEAGRSGTTPQFLSYPPQELLPHLPNQSFLNAHPTTEFRNGLMVRWSDTRIPSEYLKFNRDLFQKLGKTYDPASFEPDGFIDHTWKERNCPEAFYFAPQRELSEQAVLLSNHFLIPEMRLTAMNHWTNEVAKRNWDDIQWRYDELSHRLVTAIRQGAVTRQKARELIDFLDPSGDFPCYYNSDNKPLDQVQVHGSVSLLDLKDCSIESHFGYSADEWVKITLPNYTALAAH
jgi:hypothetical protein